MNELRIIKPGTAVTIHGLGSTYTQGAEVEEVIISEIGVLYKLSWWNNGLLQNGIFPPSQFTIQNEDNIELSQVFLKVLKT